MDIFLGRTKPVASAKKVAMDLQIMEHVAPSKSSSNPFPLVLASLGVQGKLSLRYNEPALPIRSTDIVKISLHGCSKIKLPCKPSEAQHSGQRFKEAIFSFLDLVEVSHINPAVVPTDEPQIHFSFVLSNVVSHLTTSLQGQNNASPKGQSPWMSMPSSLSAESISTNHVTGGSQSLYGKITYTIRVHVFRRAAILGYTERVIHIFNDMETKPPTCIADFPTEFRCRMRGPVTRYLRKTGASFTAMATEPTPFVFCANEDSALTVLPVTFAAFGLGEGKAYVVQRLMPEISKVKFTWRLKSLTFLSAYPLTSMPTVKQAMIQSSLRVITMMGKKHQLKFELTSGDASSSSSSLEPPGSRWNKTVRLPLLLSKPTLPVPPMFTPFMSRRYSLVIQVNMVGRLGGKTTIQLDIPVQILYQQRKDSVGGSELPPFYESRSGTAPEDKDCVLDAPIYSP